MTIIRILISNEIVDIIFLKYKVRDALLTMSIYILWKNIFMFLSITVILMYSEVLVEQQSARRHERLGENLSWSQLIDDM